MFKWLLIQCFNAIFISRVVIKTVVYEIGILTDDSNNTNSGSEESWVSTNYIITSEILLKASSKLSTAIIYSTNKIFYDYFNIFKSTSSIFYQILLELIIFIILILHSYLQYERSIQCNNLKNFFCYRQEEIAFSFFNPNHNNSLLDLSNIPVPVQTNISGVTITGVAPANFGTINLLPDGTPTLNASALPLFPNKQVTVTHNFTTIDKSQSALLLDSLSDLLGLKLPKIHDINNGTDSKSSSSTTVTTSTTRGNDLKSTSRSTDSDKRTSENRGSSSSTSTTENTKESSSEIES